MHRCLVQQSVHPFDGRGKIYRRSPEPSIADARFLRRSSSSAAESRHFGDSTLLFGHGSAYVLYRLRTLGHLGHCRRTVSVDCIGAWAYSLRPVRWAKDSNLPLISQVLQEVVSVQPQALRSSLTPRPSSRRVQSLLRRFVLSSQRPDYFLLRSPSQTNSIRHHRRCGRLLRPINHFSHRRRWRQRTFRWESSKYLVYVPNLLMLLLASNKLYVLN